MEGVEGVQSGENSRRVRERLGKVCEVRDVRFAVGDCQIERDSRG